MLFHKPLQWQQMLQLLYESPTVEYPMASLQRCRLLLTASSACLNTSTQSNQNIRSSSRLDRRVNHEREQRVDYFSGSKGSRFARVVIDRCNLNYISARVSSALSSVVCYSFCGEGSTYPRLRQSLQVRLVHPGSSTTPLSSSRRLRPCRSLHKTLIST